MGRKNLNDVLSNDRSIARAAQNGGSVSYWSNQNNKDYWSKSSANDSKGSWKTVSTAKWERCYETHPPLPITVDGKTYEIFGGSCISPKLEHADIYMGFDRGMQITTRAFPWNPGVEVLFPISDMSVPTSIGQFEKMLEWTKGQMLEGKTIHCGCIGGHGRTGLFLAALVKHMTGNEDAITYVRENYCKKAVESTSQINWLHDHFGIKKVEGSKSSVDYKKYGAYDLGSDGKKDKGKKRPPRSEEILPLGRAGSIFDGSGPL